MKDAKEISERWGFKRLTPEELEMTIKIVKKSSKKSIEYFDILETAVMFFMLNVTSPFLAFSICLILSLFI